MSTRGTYPRGATPEGRRCASVWRSGSVTATVTGTVAGTAADFFDFAVDFFTVRSSALFVGTAAFVALAATGRAAGLRGLAAARSIPRARGAAVELEVEVEVEVVEEVEEEREGRADDCATVARVALLAFRRQRAPPPRGLQTLGMSGDYAWSPDRISAARSRGSHEPTPAQRPQALAHRPVRHAPNARRFLPAS